MFPYRRLRRQDLAKLFAIEQADDPRDESDELWDAGELLEAAAEHGAVRRLEIHEDPDGYDVDAYELTEASGAAA